VAFDWAWAAVASSRTTKGWPASGRRRCTEPFSKSPRTCDDPRMTTRRFPAPWRAEKMPGGYVVRDGNGKRSPIAIAAQTKPRRCRRKC
jgi:hypothetical protein